MTSKVFSRRLSPSMNAKCLANVEASKLIVSNMNEATRQMDEIWTNGWGILSDRLDTGYRISAAISALQKAQTAMRGTDWLTEADYEFMQRKGL